MHGPDDGIPAGRASDDALESSPADLLPVRMLNEFVYCPRLFFYEWVDGVFADNRETVDVWLEAAREAAM